MQGKKDMSCGFTIPMERWLCQKISQEYYNHVKICGNQVIMYDGKKCSIFMKNGIQKFEGEMNNNILEIFPIAGVE